MSKLLYTDFREEGIVILVREHVKLKKRSRIFITRQTAKRLLQRGDRIPYIFTSGTIKIVGLYLSTRLYK